MGRILVSSLVGAVILFFFQALSWMALPIHTNSFKYVEQQDEIIEALSQHLEEGTYFMPNVKPGTSAEEEQAYQEGNAGKPWVILHYHEKMEMSMARNMGLGFLLDFLACLIISLVLLNINAGGFGVRMFFVTALAALVMIGGPLYQATWFETPSHYISGELIDILAGYLLAGAWMSWWTGRK